MFIFKFLEHVTFIESKPTNQISVQFIKVCSSFCVIPKASLVIHILHILEHEIDKVLEMTLINLVTSRDLFRISQAILYFSDRHFTEWSVK